MQVNRGVRYSTMLHGGLLLIFIFGLPHFQKEIEHIPSVIPIEILPVDSTSNAQQKITPRIEKPPVPPKVTTPSPPQINRTAPPSVPVTPVKPVDKTSLEEILEKVRKEALTNAEKTPVTENVKQLTTPVSTNAPSSPTPTSAPLSISEIDAIKAQIQKLWNVPNGAKDAQNLIVRLQVKASSDGTVISVKHIGDESRYLSERNFNAAVESAIRAVKQASPLQNLPADRYSSWSEMELVFNPADMAN